MKTRLLNLFELLRANFWTLPLLFLMLSTALALLSVSLDMAFFHERKHLLPFLRYFSDTQSNRVLITTTAGSILGVAGVSFSVTIASLTLASQQFGPRLLRNFMQDTFNQVVIGVFTATFLYCILILQLTSNAEQAGYVPVISVSTVLALVVVNLLVLVVFIHHISASIQADSIIADVCKELFQRLRILFPEAKEDEQSLPATNPPDESEKAFEKEGHPVCAERSGYLQAIDVDGLMALAVKQNTALKVAVRPGEFVLLASHLAWVLGGEDNAESIDKDTQRHLIIGETRTAQQDAEYAIRQLVEIAVRALSPGVNDPYTAIACIHRLGDAMAFLMGRKIPSAEYYDEDGRLRLQLKPFSFSGIMEAAFNQVRQNADSHVAIIISLLQTMDALAEQANTQEQVDAIMVQADAIYGACQDDVNSLKDRNDIEGCYKQVKETLGIGQKDAEKK